MKTEQKAGKCPKCGAELEYATGGELCDDFVAFNFECPECGLTGTEDHELVFSGFTLARLSQSEQRRNRKAMRPGPRRVGPGPHLNSATSKTESFRRGGETTMSF